MTNKIAEKDDWKTCDMPERHDSFILERSFTEQQMKSLRRGNIPQEMEDKWFWYMTGDTLYAHRSWTGFCIYIVEFMPTGRHNVTVNRDPEQYTCTSIAKDKDSLNKLLDWWTQPSYDYYNEWLTETAEALEKQKETTD